MEKVTVEKSIVYASGHIFPVNRSDKPMYEVKQGDKRIQVFYTKEAAEEFANILRLRELL